MDLDDKRLEQIINELDLLKIDTDRDPLKAQKGRRIFLQEAESLKKTVTKRESLRHKGWIQEIQSMLFVPRKERSPMVTTISTILLVISMILGGGGITVAAAQNSLPDEPLYNLKLLSEDVRLWASTDPFVQSKLALDFASRRAEEINKMLNQASVPSDTVQMRYNREIDQAIRSALKLDNEQAILELFQIRNQVETQLESMQQSRAKETSEMTPIMEQTRVMLRQYLSLLDNGLTNPDQLRDQLRLQDQDQLREQDQDQLRERDRDRDQTGTDVPTIVVSPETTAVQNQAGLPTEISTQSNGNGSGGGSGNCLNCTSTPNSQNKNGPNIETTQMPTMGNGQNNNWMNTATPYSGNTLQQPNYQNNNPAQDNSSGQSGSGSSGKSNGKH